MLKLLFLLTLMPTLLCNSTFAQTPPIEPGVSQRLAKWRAANYSDVRYKLNITLEKGAPLMKGDIEVRVKLTDEGAKNDLVLDWRTTQFANDKDKPFADVISVNSTTMGKATQSATYDYQTTKEHLLISHRFFKAGENVIKIKFASPIKTSGAAITRYVDKEDGAEYVYSLFVPSDASTAFPVFDQPDLKARFKLDVFAPKEWKVITNVEASLYDRRSYDPFDQQKTFPSKDISWTSFKETKPISTYVFAFAAGEFKEFAEFGNNSIQNKHTENADYNILSSDVDFIAALKGQPSKVIKVPYEPTRIYVRKSQSEKFKQHAAEVFRLNREGVRFLESYFDYKFPFPKYDLVLIPEFPFGGMEHAGATFLREDRVIFPTEPTKNDYITRANVIFHEAAHQWFGDTVTMRWFDDLWLKEGFAEFMAYKTLEKVMPEYNAWKIFYERNKQLAYLTDSTRGTTPIYQEIPNLSAAKSAYGNIVYRKAPSFLRQAEFYLGEGKFQTAVRAFLKKHEFANAEWTDLVKEFELANGQDLKSWADEWVKKRGVAIVRIKLSEGKKFRDGNSIRYQSPAFEFNKENSVDGKLTPIIETKIYYVYGDKKFTSTFPIMGGSVVFALGAENLIKLEKDADSVKLPPPDFVFPNYQDYGYGIFLLDEKSRAYVLENIQTEKDDFLRAMMWGSLWDSVREAELAPKDYAELVIKNINVESDESTIQTLLGRVSTAMNYYLSEPSAVADGLTRPSAISDKNSNASNSKLKLSAAADGSDKTKLAAELEKLLINKIETASSVGQKITYFRALQSIGAGEQTRQIFKDLLTGKSKLEDVELKTKDKFDLVTRLIILGDKEAANLLANLEKQNTDDAAKRYAYAARAGIATAENKAKFYNDFTNNKELSESYIESALAAFNSAKHADLTLPYLEKALTELPNLKRNRKIFFVNGWLSAFIGGQKSEEALKIVNKFLADNPNLDRDLRLKILENADNLERSVKIRAKYGS